MIIGVYGYSGSGKTSLLEALLPQLSEKYKVAAVKHVAHELDVKGKDTWRLGEAGAWVVAAASTNDLLFHFPCPIPLSDVLTKLQESADLVLLEGFKDMDVPKIAVGEVEERPHTVFHYRTKNDMHAILSLIDQMVGVERIYNQLPHLDCGLCGADCCRMAELIYRGKRSLADCEQHKGLRLSVNGKRIPLNAFTSEMITGVLLGAVRALKDVPSGVSKLTIVYHPE